MPTAIVTGATGINGLALLKALSADPKKWTKIHAVSRSLKEKLPENVQHTPLDLLGGPEKIAGELKKHNLCGEDIYVFFAAYMERESEEEMAEVNGKMLKDFLKGMEIAGLQNKALKRVVLTTGAKYYGVQLGPVKVPCEESDPRVDGATRLPNFYYVQEDILVKAAMEKKWDWLVVQPNDIIGFAHGNFMNIASAVAIYATITKELREPLVFPGNLRFYTGYDSHSHSKLIAEFEIWAALNTNISDERLNCVNGDSPTWQDMWPRVAKHFGVRIPPDQFTRPAPFLSKTKIPQDPPIAAQADSMGIVGKLPSNELENRVDLKKWAQRAEVKKAWADISKREGLREDAFEKATWGFANFVVGRQYDVVISMTKARKLGWTGYKDTWEAYEETFEELEKEKIIPNPQRLAH